MNITGSGLDSQDRVLKVKGSCELTQEDFRFSADSKSGRIQATPENRNATCLYTLRFDKHCKRFAFDAEYDSLGSEKVTIDDVETPASNH
jgi:hypothetical protein